MDMVYYAGEIIVVTFLLGAVVGAVVAVHLLQPKMRSEDVTGAEPAVVKVKAKR